MDILSCAAGNFLRLVFSYPGLLLFFRSGRFTVKAEKRRPTYAVRSGVLLPDRVYVL